MRDLERILACPETGEPICLSPAGDTLTTASGTHAYRFRNGIAELLPGKNLTNEHVREFYDETGWTQAEDGAFADTLAFVDTRDAPLAFTRQCMRRIGRFFRRGGDLLLDAGSGPIPHDELLAYGDRYGRRICVDLSLAALQAARRKIGDSGVFLQGDLTRLPLQSGSVDAATCNHVIYQIPDPELQKRAFHELWRVLKPGGFAVVVYWWETAPLAWQIERFVQLCGAKPAALPAADEGPSGGPVHAPQTLSWFQSQPWPFRYRFAPYRVVTNHFMRRYVKDDWRGRALLSALGAIQQIAPTLCGKYGAIPAIIIHKD